MVKTISFPPVVDRNGNLTVADNLEGLRQKVVARLNIFRAEWFLDVTEGVPYFEQVLTKPVDIGLITALFNTEIQKEPEVTGLGNVNVNLDPQTRHFTYAATVHTIFGDMAVEVI